jgi:hypothetical protein
MLESSSSSSRIARSLDVSIIGPCRQDILAHAQSAMRDLVEMVSLRKRNDGSDSRSMTRAAALSPISQPHGSTLKKGRERTAELATANDPPYGEIERPNQSERNSVGVNSPTRVGRDQTPMRGQGDAQ